MADFLSRPSARILLQIGAVGEMGADKLPVIPDRIEASSLLGRALFGAVAGGVLASELGESGTLGAGLGAVAAVLSAYASFHGRRALTHSAGFSDTSVALCEDALAIAVARHALRA